MHWCTFDSWINILFTLRFYDLDLVIFTWLTDESTISNLYPTKGIASHFRILPLYNYITTTLQKHLAAYL